MQQILSPTQISLILTSKWFWRLPFSISVNLIIIVSVRICNFYGLTIKLAPCPLRAFSMWPLLFTFYNFKYLLLNGHQCLFLTIIWNVSYCFKMLFQIVNSFLFLYHGIIWASGNIKFKQKWKFRHSVSTLLRLKQPTIISLTDMFTKVSVKNKQKKC